MGIVAEVSRCYWVLLAGGVETKLPRGGAVVARQAHNLEVAGSNPAPGIDGFLIMQRLFLG